MGQVRNDILNGWKEIGAYVGRDIRTVERWEKQRGLPVRRMPGAGRATVYALISELDEWLENSGPNEAEATSAAFDRRSLDEAAEQAHRPAAAHSAHDSQNLRRRWITAATLAVGVSLAGVLTWPAIRSHAKSVPALPSPLPAHPDVGFAVPYGSNVAGVDDLYRRGVYSYEQRTPESLQRSLEDFTAASAKDPFYAPAYAGLANTYNLLREYSVMPDSEAYPKAKQAAEHAISLDPRLPEAHASLGFIDFFWSWDATAGEHEFKTALALDPNSVLAHHWYGSMLMHQGRFAEAIEQLDKAQRLQPNSAAILSTRALAMGLDGHRDEAADMLEDIIRETPAAGSPHAILATLSIVEPRNPARYLAELRRSAELRRDPEILQVSAAAADAYRFHDERRMWTAIYAAEERLHPGTTHRTYMMADAEAALGQHEAAIADLAQLAAHHDPATRGMAIDPLLAPLRRDPRFIQLSASVGLPSVTN